jgi:DNA-binding NarL/FixJ family response regulator
VALGLSSKDIAVKLSKSIRIVETQRFKPMKKLGVKNVVELMNVVKEHELIDTNYFMT